jgi:hypothetical protein
MRECLGKHMCGVGKENEHPVTSTAPRVIVHDAGDVLEPAWVRGKTRDETRSGMKQDGKNEPMVRESCLWRACSALRDTPG